MAEQTTFTVQSLDANVSFYDRVLGAAGWSRFVRTASFCGYAREGDDSGDTVWLLGPVPGEVTPPRSAVVGRAYAREAALPLAA